MTNVTSLVSRSDMAPSSSRRERMLFSRLGIVACSREKVCHAWYSGSKNSLMAMLMP
jgi:hypothetical protein